METSSAEKLSYRSMIVATATIPSIIVFDQITKWLIWNTYGPDGDSLEAEYFGGLLRFHFVRNTGSAFGMFQGQTGVLTAATFLAIGLLVLFFIRNARESALVALALSMLVGGAVGNLIDRIRLGYVIDWIKLPNWPTFNVADSSITIGVVVLFIAIIIGDMQESAGEHEQQEAAAQPAHLGSYNED
jgi:signal peptidase II